MPLVYALVLRGDAIVAEHQAYHGNSAQVVRECLKKAKFEDQLIVKLEGHTVNFLRSDGHVYVVVAAASDGEIVPFFFLERIRDQWRSIIAEFGEEEGHAELAKRLKVKLAEHLASHTERAGEIHSTMHNLAMWKSSRRALVPPPKAAEQQQQQQQPDVDKARAVQDQIDEVKGIMVTNVTLLLERGEKVETLMTATEDLAVTADTFKATAKGLRDEMWWKNVKYTAALVVVLALLVTIAVLSACFAGNANRCRTYPQ